MKFSPIPNPQSPIPFLVAAVATLAVTPGFANTWKGSDDNFFTDVTAWTNGAVPGSFGEDFSNANPTDNASNNAEMSIDGILKINGNWTLDWLSPGYKRLNEDDTGSARIIQTAGDVYTYKQTRIGGAEGTYAEYTISGGSLNVNDTGNDGPLIIGHLGTGILNIDGGLVNVGYGRGAPDANKGTKQTKINDEALNFSHSVYVGTSTVANPVVGGGNGTVNQTAGDLKAGSVFVGVNGGTGEYNMSGGNISTSSWMVVGGYGNSTGTFTMSGNARVAVGWDWLVYGGNISRHWDLKNPADYPDITDTDARKNGSVTIAPNGATKNGTYFILGGVSRIMDNNTTQGSPTGTMVMNDNSQLLIQGEVEIGLGERRGGTPSPDGTDEGYAHGTLTLNDSAYVASLGDGFYVGRKAGYGVVNVNDNATLIAAKNAWFGASTPSDKKVPGAGDNRSGNSAVGILNQTGGYVNFRDTIKLGESTNNDTALAHGEINISGGEFVVGQHGKTEVPASGISAGDFNSNDKSEQGRIFLGLYGTGELNVSGGIFRFDRTEVPLTASPKLDAYFVLGTSYDENGNKGLGTVTQTGGLIDASEVVTAIGRSGGDGVFTISGGEARLREVFLGFNAAATINADGKITAWNEGKGGVETGILNIDGGVFSAKYISQQTANNGVASGVINLNGGTLKASDVAGGVFISDQVDAVNVISDSIIDINGRDISIDAAVFGTANLQLIGEGALSFKNLTSYTGKIIPVGAIDIAIENGSGFDFDFAEFTGAIAVGESASVTLADGAKIVFELNLENATTDEAGADADNAWSGTGSITFGDDVQVYVKLKQSTLPLANGTYYYNVFKGTSKPNVNQVSLVLQTSAKYSLSYLESGQVKVVVVPEPSTYAMALGAILLGVAVRRRMKNKA